MNSRTVYTLVSIASVALVSCQRNHLRIEGQLSSAPNGQIYLSVLDSTFSWTNVDTSDIEDGAFVFNKDYLLPEDECMLLTVGNQNMAIFVGNDKVTIKGSLLQPEKIVVEGSDMNDMFVDFTEHIPGRMRLAQLEAALGAMNNNVDGHEEIVAEMRAIEHEQLIYIRKSILDNADNALGPFFLLNNLRLFSFDEVDSLQNIFKVNIPDHKYVKFLDSTLASLRSTNEALKRVEIGRVAPDFTLVSEEGDTVSLSSLRGSVVLLTFWDSADSACRQENKLVREMYQKLSEKGLMLVCVSVDKNKEAWIQAKTEDRLPGYQLIDDGTVAATYCVSKIPFSLLIDDSGVIVSKDVKSEGLFDSIAAKLEHR